MLLPVQWCSPSQVMWSYLQGSDMKQSNGPINDIDRGVTEKFWKMLCKHKLQNRKYKNSYFIMFVGWIFLDYFKSCVSV